MPLRHSRFAPVPEYQPLHISTTGTVVPVGGSVSTTSATTISAGLGRVVTPTSMANIFPGMLLNIANGVGTAETVQVLSITASTFTANFQQAHSGAYTITSLRGTFLGSLIVNQAGSGITITLYNGSPNLLPVPGSALAVITPVAGAFYPFNCTCDLGLFYTVAGTTPGDYTLTYLDQPV